MIAELFAQENAIGKERGRLQENENLPHLESIASPFLPESYPLRGFRYPERWS